MVIIMDIHLLAKKKLSACMGHPHPWGRYHADSLYSMNYLLSPAKLNFHLNITVPDPG